MTGLRIDPLADVPQHTATVMTWIYNQFDAAPGRTLSDVIRGAHRFANADHLPMLFVATRDGAPLGCVVLRDQDLPGWDHLTPWLASLFVTPGARGQRIAAALARHLEGVAAIMGYERLYLHTPDAVAYYRRLGWTELALSDQGGQTTRILYKTLAPGASAW